MLKKMTAILMTLFMVLTMTAAMTPAFAITQAQAKAQANAYNKHSIGLTSVENARDLGGYKTKDGRTVKFGKLIRTGDLTNLSA
ncbi:MAG: tyrosine-protein phosphatase, partial [Clostridia bacterium]|nr:tyrosine-protein phosphatase [Clostridia bacterium]